MKVRLLEPFCGRDPGSIVTMHPMNARKYYKCGVCVGLTDEDREFLETGVVSRKRTVETQVRSDAVEDATVTPVKKSAPRTGAKKPRSYTRRKKS